MGTHWEIGLFYEFGSKKRNGGLKSTEKNALLC